MFEKNIKHNISIDISMYNINGVFTLTAYQRMIMTMIEEHLDMLNLGEKHLMEEHGISWVLLSTSIEFQRRIMPTDKIVGHTWHSGGRVPSFRRDFVFDDTDGNHLACGATVSTLFEHEARKICLNKEKLSVVNLAPESPILENLERKMKCDQTFELIEIRKVRPSMTDGVGHVNNTKYGDFVYDAMSFEERARLINLKRMDIWFNHELREGDEFEIYKAIESEFVLCFMGKKVGEQRSAFEIRLVFSE